MRVLVTFPGRAGDLLWALPAVRAVSEHFQTPVNLLIAGEFAGMVPLLHQQSYLRVVIAEAAWALTPPQDWNPPGQPYMGYDRVYHLGYRGWPAKPLPFETQDTLATVWDLDDGPIPVIDLGRAWIHATAGSGQARQLCWGWSDCWFELKYGLVTLVRRAIKATAPSPAGSWHGVLAPGSRWTTEAELRGNNRADTWVDAAQWISGCQVFLGDCSALHVLAVAMGKPVLLVEPMEARWNDLFYPLGKTGRVRLLTGNDGLPTFDSRHCADALKELLHGR